LRSQDLKTLDVSKLNPLSPEVISRQATINIGARRRPPSRPPPPPLPLAAASPTPATCGIGRARLPARASRASLAPY